MASSVLSPPCWVTQWFQVIPTKRFERTVSAQEAVGLFLICCHRQFFSWNGKHGYYYTYPIEKETGTERTAQVPLEKPDLNL